MRLIHEIVAHYWRVHLLVPKVLDWTSHDLTWGARIDIFSLFLSRCNLAHVGFLNVNGRVA